METINETKMFKMQVRYSQHSQTTILAMNLHHDSLVLNRKDSSDAYQTRRRFFTPLYGTIHIHMPLLGNEKKIISFFDGYFIYTYIYILLNRVTNFCATLFECT